MSTFESGQCDVLWVTRGILQHAYNHARDRLRNLPTRLLPLRSKMRNWSLLPVKDCGTRDEFYILFNFFNSYSFGMISSII